MMSTTSTIFRAEDDGAATAGEEFVLRLHDDERKVHPISEHDAERAPWFSLEGLVVRARVLYAYDGDTVTVAFPFSEHTGLHKVKCRLFGIDTPEKRSRNQSERAAAQDAHKHLTQALVPADQHVHVKFGDWGKYGGRALAVLFRTREDATASHKDDLQDGFAQSINARMIADGYAVAYNGRSRRRRFADWWPKAAASREQAQQQQQQQQQ